MFNKTTLIINIHYLISDFDCTMDGQRTSNDFSDESVYAEMSQKETQVDSQIKVVNEKSSHGKQQRPKKGQWIVILEKLRE